MEHLGQDRDFPQFPPVSVLHQGCGGLVARILILHTAQRAIPIWSYVSALTGRIARTWQLQQPDTPRLTLDRGAY